MAEEVEQELQNKQQLAAVNKDLGMPPDFDPVKSLTTKSSYNPIPEGFGIKEQITGNAITGPNPGVSNRAELPKFDTSEYVKASLAKVQQSADVSQNPYKQMREYSFNGDHDGANFARYYSHPKFKQLGFNPYRNNEELYNKHSTFGNEMSRATGQWGNLVWTGFKSGLSSWGDIFTGNALAPDIANAEAMNRAMAIGSSSKGGASGFFVNTFLNSGYSIGVGLEMLTEELGLLGVTALSGGLAAPATIPEMGAVGARGGLKLFDYFKTGSKNLSEYANKLNTVEDLKGFWATGLGKATSATGRVINPLSHTMGVMKGVGLANQGTRAIRNIHNFGEFARDFRDIKGAVTESKLEAGLVQIETTQKLIDQYKVDHDGAEPEGKELEKIHNLAKEEAYTTAYWNMPIIMMSNKFMYESIFAKLKPSKLKWDDDIIDESGARIVLDKKKGVELFEGNILNKLKFTGKALISPRKYGKFMGTYLKANIAEGLQENMQETVSGAAIDDALARYNSKDRGGYETFMGHIFDNAKKQFSMQGLETFTSGLLMGAIAQPIMGAPVWTGKQAWNMTAGKGDYQAYKAQRNAQLKQSVDYVNTMHKNPEKFFAANMAQSVAQGELIEDMYAANQSGDLKLAKDAQAAVIHEGLYTALRMGHYDLLLDKFKDFRNLDDEALEQAFNLEKGQATKGREMLESYINRAEAFKTRFDYVNDNVVNPYNPSIYKTGTATHTAMQYANQGFEEMKRALIFDYAAYDRNNERLQDMVTAMSAGSKPLSKVAAIELTNLMDPKASANELALLESEIETLTTINLPENKKLLAQKQKKRDLLANFHEAMSNSDRAYDEETFKHLKDNIEAAGIKLESNKIKRDESGSYIPGTMVHDTSKNLYEVNGISEIVSSDATTYTLSNGEVVPKERIEPLTSNYIKSQTRVDTTNESRQAYKDYIYHLADENDDFVFNEKLEESFQLLLDFRAKSKENKNLVKYINYLNDPRAMLENATRVAKFLEKLHKEDKDNLVKRISDTVKKYEFNRGTNALAEDGWFISRTDMEALIKAIQSNTVPLPIPKEFVNTTTGKTFKEGTPEYTKALEVWNKHVPAIEESFKDHLAEEEARKKDAVHTVVSNQDGTFSVLNPEGKIVGQPFATKEDADQVKEELNTFFEEEKIKQEELELPEGFVDIDTMPYSAYPQELKDQLDTAYSIYLEKNNIEDTAEEKENWLEGQSSMTIINKWNEVVMANQPKKPEPILQTASTKEQEASLNKIKKLQDEIGNKKVTDENYIINGKPYNRVSNVVTELMQETYGYTRPDITKNYVDYFVKNATDILNNKGSVKDYVEFLHGQAVNGILLGEFSKAKIDSIGEYLNKNGFTLDNVKKVVDQLTYEHTRIRGNNVDKHIRQYFNNGKLGPKPDYFTQEAYDNLGQILDSIKDKLTADGYAVVANDLTIWDDKAEVAGTLDLLLIDQQGNYVIYDIKTGKKSKWQTYELGQAIPDGKLDHSVDMTENTMQLSIYKNILENQTGIRVKALGIIPIETTEDKDGNVISVKAGKIGNDGKIKSIPLTYNKAVEAKVPIVKTSSKVPTKKAEILTSAELVERNVLPQTMEELDGKKVERNNILGTIIIGGPDTVLFESDNVYYTLEGADIYSNPKDFGLEGLPKEIKINEVNEVVSKKKYNVENITNDTVIVNSIPYTINYNSIGNIESLSPLNKPDQRIKNEKLLIAVEIERNKQEFNTIPEEVNNTIEQRVVTNSITSILNTIYNKNLNDVVTSGLNKLYSNELLSDQERLQVELWAFDALENVFNLLDDKYKNNEELTNASNNLDIIINLLYGNQETNKQASLPKSTKEGKRVITKQSSKRQAKKIATKKGSELVVIQEKVSLQEAKDMIDVSTSLESLDEIRTSLLKLASQNKLDNSLEIEDYITKHKQKLLARPVASSLKKGMRVLIGGNQYVITYMGKTIKAVNTDGSGEKLTIKPENVSTTIDQIIDLDTPVPQEIVEPTAAEKIVVKQSLDNTREITDQEFLQDEDKGKNVYSKKTNVLDGFKKKKC